jgi:hypothetical protein
LPLATVVVDTADADELPPVRESSTPAITASTISTTPIQSQRPRLIPAWRLGRVVAPIVFSYPFNCYGHMFVHSAQLLNWHFQSIAKQSEDNVKIFSRDYGISRSACSGRTRLRYPQGCLQHGLTISGESAATMLSQTN